MALQHHGTDISSLLASITNAAQSQQTISQYRDAGTYLSAIYITRNDSTGALHSYASDWYGDVTMDDLHVAGNNIERYLCRARHILYGNAMTNWGESSMTPTTYFTADGSITANKSIYFVFVMGSGGGGGGGGSNSGTSSSGGGGGGGGSGYRIAQTIDVQYGSTISVNIGSVGSGGANNTSGGAGGATTLTYYDPGGTQHVITASGGAGGQRGYATRLFAADGGTSNWHVGGNGGRGGYYDANYAADINPSAGISRTRNAATIAVSGYFYTASRSITFENSYTASGGAAGAQWGTAGSGQADTHKGGGGGGAGGTGMNGRGGNGGAGGAATSAGGNNGNAGGVGTGYGCGGGGGGGGAEGSTNNGGTGGNGTAGICILW